MTTQSTQSIDFSVCETPAIRTPGTVQSFGVCIAFIEKGHQSFHKSSESMAGTAGDIGPKGHNSPAFIAGAISENAGIFYGTTGDHLLGQPIDHFFEATLAQELTQFFIAKFGSPEDHNTELDELVGNPAAKRARVEYSSDVASAVSHQINQEHAQRYFRRISKSPVNSATMEVLAHVWSGIGVVDLLPVRGDGVSSDRFANIFAAIDMETVESQQRLEEDLKTLAREMASCKNIYQVSQLVSDRVSHITGYHRIMIYRFNPPDQHGEVIAETIHPDYYGKVVPYLGLRYPPTDIPKVARRLYELNPYRLVFDVNSVPADILSLPAVAGGNGQLKNAFLQFKREILSPRKPVSYPKTQDSIQRHTPLDLTFSVLRSISPYHIQYLKNMGVRASLSVSIMKSATPRSTATPALADSENELLWGLIAFHHFLPRAINFPTREYLMAVSRLLTQRIEQEEAEKVDQIKQMTLARCNSIHTRFSNVLREKPETVLHELLFGDLCIAEFISVQSIVLFCEDWTLVSGKAPPYDWCHSFLRWVMGKPSAKLQGHSGSFVRFMTDSLKRCTDCPCEAVSSTIASGVLVAVISEQPLVALLAFRPETRCDVMWGGDPSRPATVVDSHLTPRASFTAFKQSILDTGKAWDPLHVASMESLCAELALLLHNSSGIDTLRKGVTYVLHAISDQDSRLYSVFSGQFIDKGILLLIVDAKKNNSLQLEDHPWDQQLHLNGVALSDKNQAVAAESSTWTEFKMGSSPCIVNKMFWELFVSPEAPPSDERTSFQAIQRLLLSQGISLEAILTAPDVHKRAIIWSPFKGQRTLLIERAELFSAYQGFSRVKSCIALVFRDVTLVSQMETAEKVSRQALQATVAAKSKLLSVVAHELRGPLNAIIGFSDYIQSQCTNVPDEVLEYVMDIQNAGNHLLTVVNDLLDYSTVERGSTSMLLETGKTGAIGSVETARPTMDAEVNLVDIVCNACLIMRTSSQKKSQIFLTRFPENPIIVRIYPPNLKRIIINLLDNAIKYTPAKGSVECAIEYDAGNPLLQGPCIIVKDTGRGMPPEDLDRVFEPFYQCQTTEPSMGVGLGLAMVKSLVQQFGGTIDISSQLGTGTTVQVTLPPYRVVNNVSMSTLLDESAATSTMTHMSQSNNTMSISSDSVRM